METKMQHIIQRQTFLFDTIDQQYAFHLQERISKYCREQLPASLEAMFDHLIDGDDNIIRIDKLEIDAGTVSLKSLEEELTKEILSKGARQLNNLINDTSKYQDHKNGLVEKYTKNEILEKQLLFFLQHGYWHGWTNPASLKNISEWLITPHEDNFKKRILFLIKKNQSATYRLIYHFEDKVLAAMIPGKIPGVPFDILGQALAISRKFTKLSTLQIREKYWLSILNISGTSKVSLTSIVYNFYELLQRDITSFDDIFSNNKREVFFSGLKYAIEEAIEKKVFVISSKWTELINDALHILMKSTNSDKPGNKYFYDPVGTEIKPEAPLEKPTPIKHTISDTFLTDDDIGEKVNENTQSSWENNLADKWAEEQHAIYVSYAGIVLLHPYLSILFDEMKLIEKRKWVDEKACIKGVQVLAYLAKDEIFCAEYEMTLLKLLCGFPLDDFISPEIVLDENEQHLCKELIEGVIKQWSAIGTISPTGLREAFLQREGKLVRVDNGWRLIVERKTIDILLNKLSWGLSLVKLPWMPQILYVDWI